jgi:hypothetical protein
MSWDRPHLGDEPDEEAASWHHPLYAGKSTQG